MLHCFAGESLLWRLLIQLMSTTRHIHGRGLAVRVVEPAHIILTSGTCARFSSVGASLIPYLINMQKFKNFTVLTLTPF